MRAILQRVSQASVTVDSRIVSAIERGWLVLLGVATDDQLDDVAYLAEKILHLRAFADADGKMNLSVLDITGSILVVSQFTLLGDCRKGRRPGFSLAAPPPKAAELYQNFVTSLAASKLKVATGTFQAHMDVQLTNDGPVTFILDSKKHF